MSEVDEYFLLNGFKMEETVGRINTIKYIENIGSGKERKIVISNNSVQGIFCEGNTIYPLCFAWEEIKMLYKKGIERGWLDE